MKKQLFMIRRGKRGEPVRDSNGVLLTFDSKMVAKRHRDEINDGSDTFVVSPGPDHKRFGGM